MLKLELNFDWRLADCGGESLSTTSLVGTNPSSAYLSNSANTISNYANPEFLHNDTFLYGVDGASIELPYCVKQSNVNFYRSLDEFADKLTSCKSATLIFDGVQGGAIIRLNGVVVGTVANGYEKVEITQSLGKTSNILHLQIKNHSGSAGIAGGVWLQICESDIFVVPDSISVETTQIGKSFADTKVKFDIATILDSTQIRKNSVAVEALVEVFTHDSKGNISKRKARKLKKCKLNKNNLTLEVPIKINKPILYKPSNIDSEDSLVNASVSTHSFATSNPLSNKDSSNKNIAINHTNNADNKPGLLAKPFVYTARITLKSGNKEQTDPTQEIILDSESTLFAVRQLGRRGRNLVYNGRVFRPNGVKISTQNHILGAMSLPSVEQKKLDKILENKYNTVRVVGFPTEAFLNACDKLGVMCVVDILGVIPKEMELFYFLNFEARRQEIIKQRVQRLRNHPCVVAYCIGDCEPESYGRGSNQNNYKAIELVQQIRLLDSKNYITAVIAELFPTLDEIEQFAGNSAKQKILSAESREMASELAIYLSQDKDIFTKATQEYCSLLDFVCYKNLSHRYEQDSKKYPKRLIIGVDHEPKLLYQAIELGEDCLNVVGDIAGEYCFDYYGNPTPASEYRQILIGAKQSTCIVAYDADTEPVVINGQESWNFPRELGKPIKIDVFTSGDVVALQDDKNETIGRKLAGRRNARKASFEVEYKPGNLSAVVYRKGAEQARAVLSGTSMARKTKMIADKKILSSKHRDMSIVDLKVLDKEDRIVNYANREVTLMVSPELQVVAIGNSAAKTTNTIQMYQDEVSVQVVDGKARFAIIGLQEGRGKVKAFCEGLLQSSLSVTVKA